MGFWIFMMIMDLLLPVTMIGFGRYFMKKAPNEINAVFGYRTSMSMKNKDTWEFAHKYCGKIWYVCGLVLLPVTVIFMLLVIGKSEDYVGTVGGILEPLTRRRTATLTTLILSATTKTIRKLNMYILSV